MTPLDSTKASPAAHTPGPWKSDARGNIANSEGVAVCHWAREEDRPLITAAPDLLAALELVLWVDGTTTPGERNLRYANAAAAIAKAKAKGE